MKFRYTIISVILLVLFACSNNKRGDVLNGVWQIGLMKSGDYDYERILLGNNFYFFNNFELKTPRMINHDYEKEATWKLIINEDQIDSISIKSENKIFENKYKVRFLINKINSRLFMELKSDSLEIIVYKYFTTISERNNFINIFNIKTIVVSDHYSPQLKSHPDNRKTLD